MNLPKFLTPFESTLKPYQRSCVKIVAHPIDAQIHDDPLSISASKFLGNPFSPVEEEYPSDANGDPLILVAQINFAEVPEMSGFPRSGLLQLYFSPTKWYDEDGYLIKYISEEELQRNARQDFSFISESLYEELPVWKIHEIDFEKNIDFGGAQDCQFDFTFDGLDFWDYEDTLTDEDKELFHDFFDASGHKVGGYAEFTQGDPRDYSANQRKDIQLLQIDVDDEIMFGDSGVGHIFINPADLKSGAIEKAYFYWDCC